MNNFDKETLDKIYRMYINEKFGYNEICKICKNRINFKNGPVPIFHIGKNFSSNNKRMVFIGLVAYGWNDIIKDQDKTWNDIFNNNQSVIDKIQLDIENRIRVLYLKNHNEVRYLSYIKSACTEIFGSDEDGFDNIVLTNFVHCNLGKVRDNLPQFVLNYCASNNYAGFIQKELEILEPTHIVILSINHKYTRFSPDFSYKLKYIEVTHPSAPGRIKSNFVNQIKTFYYE